MSSKGAWGIRHLGGRRRRPVAKTGTLTLAPGETTKAITIEVKGDGKREANETFYLERFGVRSNALGPEHRCMGTILNEDCSCERKRPAGPLPPSKPPADPAPPRRPACAPDAHRGSGLPAFTAPAPPAASPRRSAPRSGPTTAGATPAPGAAP